MITFAFTDVETTGLSRFKNYILEVAWVITDEQFNVLSRPARSFIVDHGSEEWLVAEQIKNSPFILNMHSESGLLADLADPETVKVPMEDIQNAFVQDLISLGRIDSQVRFAGFSVSFDREFLRENGWSYIIDEDTDSPFHMHHRILDLSTNKQMYDAAGVPVPQPAVANENPHRALDDAFEALGVAQAVRDNIRQFA